MYYNLKFMEILDIKKAGTTDKAVEELTLPVFEDLDLKRLAREQSWQGINERAFKRIIKGLKVKE